MMTSSCMVLVWYVVPAALRRSVLAPLHDSHRGAEVTKRRARQAVYWPGIYANIVNTVSA